MSHVGLRSQVKFKKDLGYFFADDRNRTFRLESSFFTKLMKGVLTENGICLTKLYPSLFRIYRSKEEAIASFTDKAI
jgi:hypothetical protein